MHTIRAFKKTATLVVIAGLFGLSGCTDALLDAEEAHPVANRPLYVEASPSGKLRHAHLLDRATVVPQAGKADGLIGQIGLVIGFSDESVSSSRVASRYRIASRYEYDTVFPGMAGDVSIDSLAAVLARMATDPDIDWVEPDIGLGLIQNIIDTARGVLDLGRIGLTLGQRVPWGVEHIGGTTSSTRSGNGRGRVDVDLYVLDTGARHRDLNVVECIQFADADPRPCGTLGTLDIDRHGTQVAGAAAAKDNRSGLAGVAPGARVHAFKVLNDLGVAELSSIIAYVELITERKLADPSTPIVVNMSLGADVGTTAYNGLDEAIRASIDTGVVYVIAAGNDGIDAATVTPAHVVEAITVGAYASDDTFAWFSNYGPMVDILAPGEAVETLWFGNTIVWSSGTSIAAPHVAGAAALLLARRPWLSPERVRRILLRYGRAGITGQPAGTTDKTVYVGRF